MCGLGLCPFTGLVCDLLLRSRRGLSLETHCRGTISFHIRDRQCLEDTKVTWCLSYPDGGYQSMDATFLGSQGDLIVGTFQPTDACQPTDIVNCFYPLFLPTIFTHWDGLASCARQSDFNPGAARPRGVGLYFILIVGRKPPQFLFFAKSDVSDIRSKIKHGWQILKSHV